MMKNNPVYTGWTYEGDFNEALMWLPYAIGLLRTLDRNRVCMHNDAPAAGISIRINPTTGLIHITAGGYLYLESGFYTFTYSEVDGVPVITSVAQCNYNSSVTGLLANDNPDQGKAKIEKGANELGLTGEVLVSGFASRAFNYANYVSNPNAVVQDFIQKHTAMVSVPSSVFAGKLRLLVQAKYGSKNYDVTFPVGFEGTIQALSWNGTVLNPSLNGAVNSGLLTTSDGDYFLSQVGYGQATFIKLKFSGSANTLLDKIKKGDFDDGLPRASSSKTRAEAYVLAQAVLTEETYTVTWTPQPSVPLYYGWHWNWDGKTAYCVKPSVEDYGNGNMCINWRLCKLSISHVKNQDGTHSFTVTETVESEVKTGWIGAYFHICYPFENKLIDACYSTFWLGAGFTWQSILSFTSTPIYCWVDIDDGLHLASISQSIAYKTNQETGGTAKACYPSGGTAYYNNVYNGNNGTYSIDIDGSSIDGAIMNCSLSSIKYFVSAGNETDWSPASQININLGSNTKCDGSSAQQYLYNSGYVHSGSNSGYATGETYNGHAVYYGVRYKRCSTRSYYKYYQDYYGGRQEISYLTGVIPYDDCSSMFVFNKNILGGHTIYYGSDLFGPQIVLVQVFTGYYPIDGSYENFTLITVLEEFPLQWQGVYQSSALSWEPHAINEACNLALEDGSLSEIATLVDLNADNDGSYPGTYGTYDYFYFDIEWPFIEWPDNVKQSITGGYEYYTSYQATGAENGYPGTCSVGWA